MADNKTVAELDAASSAATTDLIVVDKAGVGTVKMTIADFNTLVGTSFTGVPVAVRLATVVDGTLATDFANGQTIDGVVIATGDRLLLKNQSAGAENGVWIATAGAPTRALDMDENDELQLGMLVAVAAGSIYAQSIWQLTTAGPYVVGTTSLTWTAVVLAFQQTHVLNDITDVTAPTPSADDHLKWNGAAWINEAAPIPVTEWKEPCRVATDAAATLASDFEDGDTVDGIVLATGDRLLVKDQAAAAENGIYVVAASGAPARASDNDVAADFEYGFVVAVIVGTAGANTTWQFTKAGTITVDTTDIDFTAMAAGGGSSTFLGLTDSPANYTGAATKVLVVNAGEDAVEFVDSSGIVGSGAFPFKGALVKLTGDESIANATATAVPWDAEVYDAGGWWAGGSPTIFTVPAGVTRVKISANIYWASATTIPQVWIEKATAQFDGGGFSRVIANADILAGPIITAVVDVSAGDTFRLIVHQTSAASRDLSSGTGRCYFAIEAVETTESGQSATVQTTDATQTVIASAAMAADSAHTVRAYGHGREDATGDTYHFEIFGGARNEGGTSTAPAPNVTEVADAGASGWDATLVANDTTDVWEIKVTGEAAHTIDWTVTYFEIIG